MELEIINILQKQKNIIFPSSNIYTVIILFVQKEYVPMKPIFGKNVILHHHLMMGTDANFILSE